MTTDVPELLVVTGMSGAGKTAVTASLDDLGWFVVDNLPPSLVMQLVDTVTERTSQRRIAVVADVRGGVFFRELRGALDELAARGVRPHVLFLEAGDEVLVRRFESARRPHPLQGEGRVLDAISRERELLAELRTTADLVVDTSVLNVHELADRIRTAFAGTDVGLQTIVVSFGYKYGIPVDADVVADMRFLPNPHWVPHLRPQTGRDEQVSDYVLGQPGAAEFLDRYAELLGSMADGYLREGKRFVTVGVGCTGGKHRSVAMSEALAARLRERGVDTIVVHRDLGRE
ncbi:MAG TPA: RNase adapter RapZ [Jiangellaceae bacterium]|nr:RNase adapter RapZ [Jiangellaceae bacterium]